MNYEPEDAPDFEERQAFKRQGLQSLLDEAKASPFFVPHLRGQAPDDLPVVGEGEEL